MADDKFEAIVKEFGNGAHVTLPKEYIGDIMKIERVCSLTPSLFEGITDDAEVIIDATVPEDIECPVEDTGDVTIMGVVTDSEFYLSDENRTMHQKILVEGENRRYRIETQRDAGDEGWGEYTLEQEIDSDEMDETGEVISMEPREWWVDIGSVTSLAVKKKAPTA